MQSKIGNMATTSLLALSTSTPEFAVFGGAFDPLTEAHRQICKLVKRRTKLPVLLMPCWQHRLGKQPEDAKHRWNMIELVAKRYPKSFIPFDFEISHKHNGSTYETLCHLKLSYPEIGFRFVIGTDNANQIDKWHEGEKLRQNPFIVIGRPGSLLQDWYQNPPHLFIPSQMDVSSTAIRNFVERGEWDSLGGLVPSCVREYIFDNNLYSGKPDTFDVTDSDKDAPDGAIVDGYVRQGNEWVKLPPNSEEGEL